MAEPTADVLQSTTCCVCLDEHPGDHMATIDGDTVCVDCVREIFQRALDHESNYPPRWGSHLLDHELFYEGRILSMDFMVAYTARVQEYRCPPAQRVFCPWPARTQDNEGESKDKQPLPKCNEFLGHRVSKPSDVLHNRGLSTRRCKCSKYSCLVCGQGYEGSAADHKCVNLHAPETEDVAFKGLKRGRDYQICPSEKCERRIELFDGCNHIVCMCGMELCFICGEPATAFEGHWAQAPDGTGCPRYNQPGSNRAIWDGLRQGPRPQVQQAPGGVDNNPLDRERNEAVERLRIARANEAATEQVARQLQILEAATQRRARRHPAPARRAEGRANNGPQHPQPLQSNPAPEPNPLSTTRQRPTAAQRLRRLVEVQNVRNGLFARQRPNDGPASPTEHLESEFRDMRERTRDGPRQGHTSHGEMVMNPVDFLQRTREDRDHDTPRRSASPIQDNGLPARPTAPQGAPSRVQRYTAQLQTQRDRPDAANASRAAMNRDLRRFSTNFSLEGHTFRQRRDPEQTQTNNTGRHRLHITPSPVPPQHSLEPDQVSSVVRHAAASRNPPDFAGGHVARRNAQAAILSTNQYRHQVVRAAAERDRYAAVVASVERTAWDEAAGMVDDSDVAASFHADRIMRARSPVDSASPERTHVG